MEFVWKQCITDHGISKNSGYLGQFWTQKLKSDRLHMGMHIKAVFSFTCTWFK